MKTKIDGMKERKVWARWNDKSAMMGDLKMEKISMKRTKTWRK